MLKTKQETFDHVAAKLAEQGCPSYNNSSTNGLKYGCLYRGPNGTRCAAGHCFEEPEGSSVREGVDADHSSIAPLLLAAGHDMAFVSVLQDAHDEDAWEPSAWLPKWAARMREVAAEHNLSTDALDTALAARASKETTP